MKSKNKNFRNFILEIRKVSYENKELKNYFLV